MKEKKSMKEREKLIKSEHIRAAADEIISPLYKSKGGARHKIVVWWKDRYIGARNLRREACKYANGGDYPSDEDINGKGGEKRLSKFFEKYKEFKVINLEKDSLKKQRLQDYEWQREVQSGKEPKEITRSSKKLYGRDRSVAMKALIKAGYQCEYDKTHKSFISRKTNKPYMEAHHLIPMEFQNEFVDSLDRAENVICLCSNCHNEIHYGIDSGKIIRKLFRQRKNGLTEAGIDITLDKLLNMYKLIDID